MSGERTWTEMAGMCMSVPGLPDMAGRTSPATTITVPHQSSQRRNSKMCGMYKLYSYSW